jgi:hypothetical protein
VPLDRATAGEGTSQPHLLICENANNPTVGRPDPICHNTHLLEIPIPTVHFCRKGPWLFDIQPAVPCKVGIKDPKTLAGRPLPLVAADRITIHHSKVVTANHPSKFQQQLESLP